MYGEFFQLEHMPFANTADPSFFFKTAEHEEALAALLYGVTQRRGVVVVSGPPGTGKTLLAHMLVEHLRPQMQAALLLHTPESGHDLIASLCRDLGVRHRSSQSTGELVESLRVHLCDRFLEGKTVVAVIDEAQNMGPETMEHLRMLGNIEKDNAKLLQLVLLGQPELVQRLRQPQMQQLTQRVFCHRELGPLAHDQTRNYIRHRLTIAGAASVDIFTEDAIDLIHDRSGGLPRMINQIADNAMLAAYSAGQRTIDRELVNGSIRDMLSLNLSDGGHADAAATAASPNPGPSPAVPTCWPAGPYVVTAAAPSTQALDESIRRGAEVTGRLSEISRSSQQQADDLKTLIGRAESIGTSLTESERASAASRFELGGRIHEANALIREADRLNHRIETDRSAAAQLVERLGTLVHQAEGCASLLAHAGPETSKALDDSIRKAQAAGSQLSGSFQELTGAFAAADDLCARLGDTISHAGGLRESLEHAAAAVSSQTAGVQELLQALARPIQQANDLIPQTSTLADRLEKAAADAPPVLAACDDRLAQLANRLEEVSPSLRQLADTSERAGTLRQAIENALQTAQTKTGELDAVAAACQGRIEDVNKLLAQVPNTVERLDQVRQSAAAACDACEEQAKALTARLAQIPTLTAPIDSAAQRAETIKHTLETTIETAQTRTGELDAVAAACQGRIEDVNKLLAQVPNMVDWLDQVRQGAASASEACQQQAAILATQLARVSDLTAPLASATQRAEALKQALETAIGAAQTTTNQMDAAHAASQDRLDDLGRLVAQAANLGDWLDQVRQTAASACGTCQEQIDALTERLTRIPDLTAPLETACQRADGLRQLLEMQSQATESQLAQAREFSGHLQALGQSLEGQNRGAKASAAELSEAHDSLKATATQLLADSRQALEALRQGRSEAVVLDHEWARKIELLAEENRQATQKLQEMARATQQAYEARTALGRRTVGAITRIAAVQDQADRQCEAIDGKVASARDALADLTRLDEKLGESFSPAAIAELEQRSYHLTECVDRAARQADAISTLCDGAAQLQIQLAASLDDTTRQIAEATSRGRETQHGLADATAVAATQAAAVSQLAERIDAQSELLGRQIGESEAARSSLDHLRVELTETLAPQAVSALDERRRVVESLLAGLSDQTARSQAAAQTAREAGDQALAAAQQAGATRTDAEAACRSVRDQIADLGRLAEQSSQTVAAQVAQLHQDAAQVRQTLCQQMDDLSAGVAQASQAVADQLADLRTGADLAAQTISAQIAGLHQDADQVGHAIEGQTASARTLSARLDEQAERLSQRVIEANHFVNSLADRADQHAQSLAGQLEQARAILERLNCVRAEVTEAIGPQVLAAVDQQGRALQTAIDTATAQARELGHTVNAAEARTNDLDRSSRQAGEQSEQLTALMRQAEVRHNSLKTAAAAAEALQASSADNMRQARDLNEELARSVETTRQEAARIAELDGQAGLRADALHAAIGHAQQIETQLGQSSQHAEQINSDCTRKHECLTGQLEQASQLSERLDALCNQAPQIQDEAAHQVQTLSQLRQDLDKAARRLARERKLADLAIDRLHNLRMEQIDFTALAGRARTTVAASVSFQPEAAPGRRLPLDILAGIRQATRGPEPALDPLGYRSPGLALRDSAPDHTQDLC